MAVIVAKSSFNGAAATNHPRSAISYRGCAAGVDDPGSVANGGLMCVVMTAWTHGGLQEQEQEEVRVLSLLPQRGNSQIVTSGTVRQG